MIKRFTYIITALLFLFAGQQSAFSQAKVLTKKHRMADFPTRTLEVVVSGEDFTTMTFRDEVSKRWRISPFEFCSVNEYELLKSNPDHYFLLCSGEGSNGLVEISLFHGGDPKSDDPAKKPYDIISIPVARTENATGREFTLIPAVIDLFQDYVTKAMESETASMYGLRTYNSKINAIVGKTVVFCEEDIYPGGADQLAPYAPNLIVLPSQEADRIMAEGTPNMLVSFVVAPSELKFGKHAYHLVIDANTHELYYYDKVLVKNPQSSLFSSKELVKFIKQLK